MTDNKTLLLTRAVDEIRDLRRTVEILRAKVETMDSMMTLLHSRPRELGFIANSPDIVWQIARELANEQPSD